jgi:hypothetical protein
MFRHVLPLLFLPPLPAAPLLAAEAPPLQTVELGDRTSSVAPRERERVNGTVRTFLGR